MRRLGTLQRLRVPGRTLELRTVVRRREVARATVAGVGRVVHLPPTVLEAVRALALHGPVGEVTRDELDAWAETGELPACLAGSSAQVPTSERASHAKPSAPARRRSAR